MTASGGGLLTLNGITLTQGGSGAVEAGAGSRVRLSNSTIVGGGLFSSADGFVDVQGASTLTGVSFDGRLDIPGSYTLNISDSLTNDGTINLNSNNSGFTTTIDVLDDSSLSGGGEIVMAGTVTRARIRTIEATLTNTSTHTLRGYGQIEAALVNNGTVSADSAGNELILNTNAKTNNADMTASAGGTLTVNGITIAQGVGGTIEAQAGSLVQLTSATIVGGELSSSGDGLVNITGTSTLTGVEFSGMLAVPGSHTLKVSGSTVNNGTVTVNSNQSGSTTTLNFADASELGGTGAILLPRTGSRSRLTSLEGATLGSGQRLEGVGQIATALLHEGTTAPGNGGVGTMTATQPVTYSGSSVFEAQVNGSTADLLDNSSTLALDGTLRVLFVDGFSPTGFWSRQIAEGSSVTGAFDSIEIPAPTAGFVTRVVNTGTQVFVGQTCPSDSNLDGTLNFFDVSKFLANFSAHDPAADLNNDGQFNFFDVSLFLNNFSVGCSL